MNNFTTSLHDEKTFYQTIVVNYELSRTMIKETSTDKGTNQQSTLLTPDWSNLAEIIKDKDRVIDHLRIESQVKERVRQIAIATLKMEFGLVTQHNLFVRGSFSRGDFPCDDIDVFHYGPSTEYHPETWPTNGVTRPVAYDHIPQDNMEECFNTSMCMSCAALDCLPITQPDNKVENIISSTQREIFTTRNSYYLLFRLLEERWNNNQEASLFQDYDVLKRYPGSKRTIQRIFWILQAKVPEYQTIVSPTSLLLKASEDELLPEEVFLSAISVLKTIKNPKLFDKDSFSEAASKINQWFQTSLRPAVWTAISRDISPGYLHQIMIAANHKSDPKELSEIINGQDDIAPSYGKWLMFSTLSGNPSCPTNELYSIWKAQLRKIAYRCVLQNLLHNPSFPKGKVTPSEVEYDPILLNYFKRITKTVPKLNKLCLQPSGYGTLLA